MKPQAVADSERTGFEAARAAFEKAHPEFQSTRAIDELRASDYSRLDACGHVYLDYTGGGLYAESQLRKHDELLRSSVFGNPHSTNPTSLAMTELVNRCRRRVLDFFNASPTEYVVIFTPNASGALKLVGESYPFEKGGHFLLLFDNHNSVNGIREYCRAREAETTYLPILPPQMRADETMVERALASMGQAGEHNLFAYPAQSNFSGIQHPLAWIPKAQAGGWDVLLDAAAFVPTNRLNLGKWHPDFVVLSFYKMFGYPTGVGALIARRQALQKLRRPWFAGGTITVASVQVDRYNMAEGEAAFEDGTVNYLSLPAVEIGLDHLASIEIDTIHQRVRCLTSWLMDSLLSLRHGNGTSVVRLYGAPSMKGRGGTVTMNFYHANGGVIDHRVVETEAAKEGISLRSGCFCNPGAGETALELSKSELTACFGTHTNLTVDDFRLCIDGKSTGAVRVSTGLVTNFADIHHFVQFAKQFIES
ncbi:MAG: aminotransferase class V-fold PLP-dependent enzyme [Vicinamibacteria bacterium]